MITPDGRERYPQRHQIFSKKSLQTRFSPFFITQLLSGGRGRRGFLHHFPLPPSCNQIIIVFNQPVNKNYCGAIAFCAFLYNNIGINQVPEGVPGFIGFCTFVFNAPLIDIDSKIILHQNFPFIIGKLKMFYLHFRSFSL